MPNKPICYHHKSRPNDATEKAGPVEKIIFWGLVFAAYLVFGTGIYIAFCDFVSAQ